MGKVRNILQAKTTPLISVAPTTSVFEALELMFDRNIGALLVVESDRLFGVFTERDYARKVILQGKSSKEMMVCEIMTMEHPTVTLDNSIEDCMWLMTNKYIRHLPVMDGDKPIGIISIGDVVKYIIEEQKYIIGNLEHYITGI